MPPAGFEPTIPVSERPQTHILDLTATGMELYIYSTYMLELRIYDYLTHFGTKKEKFDNSTLKSSRMNLVLVHVVPVLDR
jgi:hypothetical protein